MTDTTPQLKIMSAETAELVRAVRIALLDRIEREMPKEEDYMAWSENGDTQRAFDAGYIAGKNKAVSKVHQLLQSIREYYGD